MLDTVIRWTVDVWLTVPELMVLVVIASSIGGKAVTVNGIALIISLMAWRWPARTICAQVLTMRERGYVMMSRLSGMGGLEIIFRELMPNLLPFLGASLVGSVRGAIFASIGLSALGLGPLREPTLGVTIYWVMQQNAFLRGLWWWGVMPVTIVVLMIDTMRDHNLKLSKSELEERALQMLDAVKLERHVANAYPHELSGGMKQRVCIAISITMHPKVIIADEPTSALDVVIQRQVMETLGRIQKEIGNAIILIGHDMGLMAQFVDRIAVMYAGNLMEIGSVEDIFTDPLHPYTRLLISSLPTLDTKGLFSRIPGIAPSLLELPSGCVFHPRCPESIAICPEQIPSLETYGEGRRAACHLCQQRV